MCVGVLIMTYLFGLDWFSLVCKYVCVYACMYVCLYVCTVPIIM
jgi:hypothetical protein